MPLPYLRHPAPTALHDFADNQLGGRLQARIAAHLAGCSDCRAIVAFHRSVRDHLLGAEPPSAPQSIIDRVIAERAGGARTILPASDGISAARRLSPGIAATVAAAALLIAALLFSARSTTDLAIHSPPSDSTWSIGSF